ncbi:MAG: hypothetical protein QM680_12675 [Luteolibacter sp.]
MLISGLASAQQLPAWLRDENIPPPPQDMVTDESGLFEGNPQALQRMRQALRKLAEERGFKIYVVIRSVLIGSNSTQLAGQLQQAWVPQGDGLVLVYESNSKSLGMGRGYDEDVTAPDQKWLIPSHEMMGIFSGSTKSLEGRLPPAEFMERLILRLAAECSGYFAKMDEPAPGGRIGRLAVLAFGAFLLLALVGFGLRVLLSGLGHGRAPKYRFPKTDVPQRLKAPFGGGKVMVRRFGPAE